MNEISLTENQVRQSETGLMAGRLQHLVMSSGLSTDERIGVCKALKVLEAREKELEPRALHIGV